MLAEDTCPAPGTAADPALSTQAPILVTGAPRSGSTWVGNVLSLDPRSGYIHEPFNKNSPDGRCRARFAHGFTYVTEENEAGYLAPLADTLAWKYSPGAELRRISNPPVRPRKVAVPRDLARLARDFSYFEYMRRRGQRVILKDPLALFSANWLARRFGARVVVVIRHPAAFVASLRAAGWDRVRFEIFQNQARLMQDRLAPYRDAVARAVTERPDGIEAGALHWNLMHHHIDRLRAEHPDWIFVRHEDLSRDPVRGFEDLFPAARPRFLPRCAAESRAVHEGFRLPLEAVDLRNRPAHHAQQQGQHLPVPQAADAGGDRPGPRDDLAPVAEVLFRRGLVSA